MIIAQHAALHRARNTALWTPASLADVVRWGRADGVTLGSGSAVATLHDQDGGTVHDYTQATAGARPTLIASAVNGQPALEYVTDDAIGRSDMLGLAANGARTLWVVAKLNSATARTPLLFQAQSASGSNYLGLDANTISTAGSRFGVYAHNSSYDTDLATDTGWHLHVLTVVPTVGANILASLAYYIDNVQRTLTVRNSSATVWTAMTSWNATFLGRYPGIAVFANARIADDGATASVISAGDRASLWAYAQGRYAI